MLEKIFDVSERTEEDKLRDKIQKSSDYKKLSVYPPLKNVFDEHYSRLVLEDDDINTLNAKMQAIRFVLPAAEKLQKAILGGNAWDLVPEDKPDFTSEDSLKGFMDKLVCSEDIDEELYNVTNISENDILKIFDESTIRDANALFYYADVKDLTKTNDEIIQNISNDGYYYCIEPSSIYEAKRSIDREIEGLEIQNFMANRGVSWLRLAKLGIAGVALSAAFLFTRMGIIPDSMDIAVLGASAGASVLYFLAG